MTINEKMFYKILNGKEERVKQLKHLNEKSSETVLCFTLNIPGSNKLIDDACYIFTEGILELSKILDITTVKTEKRYSGFEAYLTSKKSPKEVKKITTMIEQKHSLGRLFDIDVFYKNLKKVGRNELNLPPRKCFICEKDSVYCRRNKTHSLQELNDFIHQLVNKSKEQNYNT